MPNQDHPQSRRVHGIKCMLASLAVVAGLLYVATEVYPKIGLEFGRIEGTLFGLGVVVLLLGLWEVVTNRPVVHLFTKLDKILWWQWLLLFWASGFLTFATLFALILMNRR